MTMFKRRAVLCVTLDPSEHSEFESQFTAAQ